MHETAVALGILEAALEKSDGRRVFRVVVEIGRQSAILPDALRFSFAIAAEGTLAEGAEIEIVPLLAGELRVREMEVG